MDMRAKAMRKLKACDVDVSAAWFLLFFVYMHGVSMDEPIFDFSWVGIMPVIKVPLFNVVLAVICLAISAVVLIEPVLPFNWGSWTREKRQSAQWRTWFRGNVLLAFLVGLVTGLANLIEGLPTFFWPINAVAILGLCVYLGMVAKDTFLMDTESTADTAGPDIKERCS